MVLQLNNHELVLQDK